MRAAHLALATWIAADLFAGWGGSSLGAGMSKVPVVYAANHWSLAVAAHAANHPGTMHQCQDLQQADFTLLPAFNLLLASPSCQGMSKCGQPGRKKSEQVRAQHDKYRATAWAVTTCLEAKRPEAAIIENVLDMEDWGLYDLWLATLKRLGYHVQRHVLTASYFGVPQRRKRLFLVATRHDIGRIDPKPDAHETPFRPFIDQNPDTQWMRAANASPAIQGRLNNGHRNHGERWLSQWVTNHPGVSLDEPVRTLTTKAQWKLGEVRDGEIWYRSLTVLEHARIMGFPDHYRWPPGVSAKMSIKGLGNAVSPPVMHRLIEGLKAAYEGHGIEVPKAA